MAARERVEEVRAGRTPASGPACHERATATRVLTDAKHVMSYVGE